MSSQNWESDFVIAERCGRFIFLSVLSVISSSFSRTCNVCQWCRCLGLKAGKQVFLQFSTLTPCWQHPTRKHGTFDPMMHFASASTDLSTHMPQPTPTVLWLSHSPPSTQTLRIQYTTTMWPTTPTCNRKIRRSLSVCLVTLNLHPRPTTTYAALHSDNCYFGIMSICTVLNWSAVKSRLNTVLSYHAILANVSLAECVQIWSRVMEMSDGQYSLFSRLVSLRFSILFLPTLL